MSAYVFVHGNPSEGIAQDRSRTLLIADLVCESVMPKNDSDMVERYFRVGAIKKPLDIQQIIPFFIF